MTRPRMLPASIALACAAAVLAAQVEEFVPAEYRDGPVPPLPALAAGGGEVAVEVAVSRDGRVTGVTPLRTTPPFAALVTDAVREWEFAPARERVSDEPGRPASLQPVESSLLVVAVYRPPSFRVPTYGEAPRDVGEPSPALPFPTSLRQPPWPAQAWAGGVVLLDVTVDGRGAVADAAVIRSAPPFDGAALDAVRQWTFRPGLSRGAADRVYAIVGFPVPVTSTPKVSP